jgi:hypothetical protein
MTQAGIDSVDRDGALDTLRVDGESELTHDRYLDGLRSGIYFGVASLSTWSLKNVCIYTVIYCLSVVTAFSLLLSSSKIFLLFRSGILAALCKPEDTTVRCGYFQTVLLSMIYGATADTSESRNLHDWELSKYMTDLPPSRPPAEATTTDAETAMRSRNIRKDAQEYSVEAWKVFRVLTTMLETYGGLSSDIRTNSLKSGDKLMIDILPALTPNSGQSGAYRHDDPMDLVYFDWVNPSTGYISGVDVASSFS